MKKLKVLNKATHKEVTEWLKMMNIDLPKEHVIAYSNFCDITGEYLDHKLNIDTTMRLYDYITDVLEGSYPKLIIHVESKDRIIWAKKVLKMINEWELTDEEIEFFAFCVVYSYYVFSLDEKKNRQERAILEFTSFDEIVSKYKFAKKMKMWKFEAENFSDESKDDFGLSPDNPIGLLSIPMSYAYLDALVTEDDKEITYNRIGSFSGKDRTIIDGYDIFLKNSKNKKPIATIYINAYAGDVCKKVPKGFKQKIGN